MAFLSTETDGLSMTRFFTAARSVLEPAIDENRPELVVWLCRRAVSPEPMSRFAITWPWPSKVPAKVVEPPDSAHLPIGVK